MDRIEIVQNLKKYVDLTDDQIAQFFNRVEKRSLKKNEMLFSQGDENCPLTLIKSGCLMTYHTDEKNTDHVIQFGVDMWWTGDLHAFQNEGPSEYSVKAMTESKVYTLDHSAFEKLLQEAICFERYFRIIFQNSLVAHQRRIIRNISFTAEKKYKAFTEAYPQLELIVPQKTIASYLGITPEFLSKIRRRLAEK